MQRKNSVRGRLLRAMRMLSPLMAVLFLCGSCGQAVGAVGPLTDKPRVQIDTALGSLTV